jgi:hypothetical protein
METRRLIPVRLPRIAAIRPMRYLGRRVIQAMADNAVANFILGERTVPGRFLILRLAPTDDERAAIEQEFSESREAIERQIAREASARQFRLRSPLELQLLVLTDEELSAGDPALARAAAAVGAEPAGLADRLREQTELILCRRTPTVQIETEPPGAAVYLQGRQMDRVTPCTVSDVAVGEHPLKIALPGYLIHESNLVVPDTGERRQRLFIQLQPEPPMGLLEVVTFPSRAEVRIGDEVRESPATFRLPAGNHRIEARLPDYSPVVADVCLDAAVLRVTQQIALRLDYAGPDLEEPVGRLIVYQPLSASPPPPEEAGNAVASFFRHADSEELDGAAVAGERLLHRGVLLIGRDDAREVIRPDVRLRDPGNTVSRGCHAWLHIYSDPGTGADYNTFVIHNNSSRGVRVDGKLVTESVALSDDSLMEIGVFRIRVLKEATAPRVEL